MQNPPKVIALSLACFFLFACAGEKYTAKPISVEKTTAKLLAKDPLGENFTAYLVKQGYKETELPLNAWGLDELTLCALYFHPKLDVAKAELGLANTAIETAGQTQTPTINASLAHSNQKNGDIRPWAYGLNVEIPIETANKRAIKIEEAEQLAAATRMDIADTAWQLRSQIAKDLTEYHQNIASVQLLQSEVAVQTDIVNMLQKRLDAGLASKTELSMALQNQLKAQSSLNAAQAKSAEFNTRLAADVGLSPDKFKQLPLKPLEIDTVLNQQSKALDGDFVNKNLQETALLNRIDIRRSLAKYAAAEAKIKLEIAKQTPDISLSPGVAFEFGDSIWSLGFSTLLGLLQKNPTQIAEAKQLREIEGAQFEALQAKIVGDLNQACAHYQAVRKNLSQAETLHQNQLTQTKKLQIQFDSGLIDRLELKQASLADLVTEQQLLAARFDLLNAANQLEDVMQAPLYSNFIMPNQ
jgi:outer membrane protein, heavy metal efflux system